MEGTVSFILGKKVETWTSLMCAPTLRGQFGWRLDSFSCRCLLHCAGMHVREVRSLNALIKIGGYSTTMNFEIY